MIGDIKPTFYSGAIKLKIEKLLKTELNTLFLINTIIIVSS